MLKHQESASFLNLVITKIFLTFRLYGLLSPYWHNFYPLNHDPNTLFVNTPPIGYTDRLKSRFSNPLMK